jgi:hypothetical protein
MLRRTAALIAALLLITATFPPLAGAAGRGLSQADRATLLDYAGPPGRRSSR